MPAQTDALVSDLLIFRNQQITPRQQIDFSRRFGPLQIHVLNQFQLAGQPEILVISNIREDGKPIGLGDAGHYWHSDLSYVAQPSLGSMLHAQELPAEGGDTLFANQHRAWDALPARLKAAVEGLRAEHWYLCKYAELQKRNPWRPELTQTQIDAVKPVAQPIVRTHPETGRKALYIIRPLMVHFDGMSKEESDGLAEYLYEHSHRPEFTCRFRWEPGSLAFWDNRCTQHTALNDTGPFHRVMRRVQLTGDKPA